MLLTLPCQLHGEERDYIRALNCFSRVSLALHTCCAAGGRQPGTLLAAGVWLRLLPQGLRLWDWDGLDPVAVAAALKGALTRGLHKYDDTKRDMGRLTLTVS